jgi:hypothetical protein
MAGMSMAIANISVSQGAKFGPMLLSLVAGVFSTRDQARRIKEMMDQHTDGTTWTTLEAQFGLPAGTGQATYNLVAGLTGVTGALEASAVTQFCDRVG